MSTPLGKYPARNLITEQPDQVSFLMKAGGSEKFLAGIVHPFRNHKASPNELIIQPTINKSNQSTIQGHSDWYYFPLGSLKSGTYV